MKSMALLTTRKGYAYEEHFARSINTTTPAVVDNYLGYTSEIIHLCVRISSLRAPGSNLSMQSYEVFDMYV